MANNVEIDRQHLRKALENVLFTPVETKDTPEPPEFVDRMDPETIADLFKSGSIENALRELRNAIPDANWCQFCGAESGTAPRRPGEEVMDITLTDEMIDTLADEMLDAVTVK